MATVRGVTGEQVPWIAQRVHGQTKAGRRKAVGRRCNGGGRCALEVGRRRLPVAVTARDPLGGGRSPEDVDETGQRLHPVLHVPRHPPALSGIPSAATGSIPPMPSKIVGYSLGPPILPDAGGFFHTHPLGLCVHHHHHAIIEPHLGLHESRVSGRGAGRRRIRATGRDFRRSSFEHTTSLGEGRSETAIASTQEGIVETLVPGFGNLHSACRGSFRPSSEAQRAPTRRQITKRRHGPHVRVRRANRCSAPSKRVSATEDPRGSIRRAPRILNSLHSFARRGNKA